MDRAPGGALEQRVDSAEAPVLVAWERDPVAPDELDHPRQVGIEVREVLLCGLGHLLGVLFDELVGDRTGEDLDSYLSVFLDELYANTKLDDPDERMRMFGLSNEELMAEGDYFIALAAKFYIENEERVERDRSLRGRSTLSRPTGSR